MKKYYSVVLSFAIATTGIGGLHAKDLPEYDPESCTSIMVGKKATTDGSVITSHTCDGNYRTWIDIVPATDYGHDTTAVVVKGRMHTDHKGGARGMKTVGEIPQPGKTYSFVNTAYPCLNEKQLGMGETTISGRKELVNPDGMFNIEELERLALQRCTTAREAISLMGELIKDYGYGDWGECLTIADPQEVWHFEVFGEGPDNIGGVWAAVRIPDDEIGVSANIPRIGRIDRKDKNNVMASENAEEVAKKLGLWDGKGEFNWWKAFAGANYLGEKKNYSVRELFIMQQLAPSLGLTAEIEELPISIKPDAKVDVTEVMKLLTSTYEGTDLDCTRNLLITRKNRETQQIDTIVSPAANPWMTRDMSTMLNGIKEGTVSTHRTVSVPQCSYSTVIQLRSWLPDDVGGIVWLSLDNPGQSPRIPVFSGTTKLPAAFDVCGQIRYDENSAIWPFRRANKLATVRYGATRAEMEEAQNHFMEKGQAELPYVESRYAKILEEEGQEAARKFLTGYTADFAGAATSRWNELGNAFWTRYARGF